jgi:hypothetical protein
MEIKIDCKDKARKFFIAALLPSILAQLKLTHCNKSLYIVVEKQEEEALAIDTGFGYVVSINTGLDVKTVATALCHEMVHVKQMITGKLQGNHWCGKDHSKTDYLSLPWEVQAFAQQEIIYRRAFATL